MSSDPSEPRQDDPPATEAAAPNTPAVARRMFLRSFSRESANAAIQAAGIAVGLQRATGEAIASALGMVDPASPAPASDTPGIAVTPAADPIADPAAPPVRTPAVEGARPYRVEDGALWVIDAIGDPRAASEIRCATVSDLAAAMRERRVFGPPLLAELTAFGLWLALLANRGATAQIKRTRIRTSGAVLRAARSNVTTIDWAVGRMVAAWDVAVTTTDDETALENAMLAAADDVASQMRTAVAAQSAIGADAMPDTAGSPIGLLTLGVSGYPTDPDGGGGVAGIVADLVKRGRPVRAWVLETRPFEHEARATARGLARAGAETSVVADAAAAWLLATKPIHAVITGADRIGLDGAVTSVIGTYGLAAIARGHGVPCYAIATRSTIDREVRDPSDPGVEAEPSPIVDARDHASTALTTRIGARGSLQDITPPDLISAIVTDGGVLEAPFDEAIGRAIDDETATA